MRCVLVMTVLCLVSACGTRYQEGGLTGGVRAEQITQDTYRISAKGNAYTSGTTIQDYVLLKAAEATLAVGATHFVVLSAADATRVSTIVSPGSATTTFYGNTALTSYNPATVSTFIKPGQDAYIKVIRASAAQPVQGISAAEIIKYVGPRVQRGNGVF